MQFLFKSCVNSSEDTTPLFLFTSPFTKVRCSLWLSKSAVRFSTPPRHHALLLCIHPGFYLLLLSRCLKCHRSHQPAFCTDHLWLFICLVVMTCCKSGEVSKRVNCMRPKVISQMESHKHSKSIDRVLLVAAAEEPCLKACLQFSWVKGKMLFKADCPSRTEVCPVKIHHDHDIQALAYVVGQQAGNLVTEALWNRIGGEKRWEISGTPSGSVQWSVFFLSPCSSPGDNQSARSCDREIDGSFQSVLYFCLVLICVWSLVTNCTHNTSCSRSGNSLMLIHCLIHKSYPLFLFFCFRVELYIPVKWVAKS